MPLDAAPMLLKNNLTALTTLLESRRSAIRVAENQLVAGRQQIAEFDQLLDRKN